MSWAFWLSFLVTVSGCGAKTNLSRGWPPVDAGVPSDGARADAPLPRDGGPPRRDGGRDAGIDAGPRALSVICPGPSAVRVGEEVTLSAIVDAPAPLVDARWSLDASPPRSTAELRPIGTDTVQIRPDVEGDYVLRYSAIDDRGESATCITVLTATMSRPPVVECPRERITAPTRSPVELRAFAEDDAGIARVVWEVVERPAMSIAMPMPRMSMVTTFTPDRIGRYVLQFTATDIEGFTSTCMVVIEATPTPPTAVCPPTIETTPLTTVEVTGGGIDDGRIVSFRWRVLSRPPGSAAEPPVPGDAAVARFTPDVAGEYVLELTVTDDRGETATCTVRVRAIATEGLRVEMSWDQDGTDMDTHLLHPMATRWFDDTLDCYFGSCNVSTGRELEWFMPGVDDNPHLDLDDTDGLGPENINIDRPPANTFRVGIHAWSAGGRTNRVTVRIYCGGSTTMPRQTFGPAPLDDEDFWRVADVQILAGGRCRITDLSTAGGFNISTADDARARR